MEEPQCTWRGDAGGQTWLPMHTPPGITQPPDVAGFFPIAPFACCSRECRAFTRRNLLPEPQGSQQPCRTSPAPPHLPGAKGAAPLLPLQSSVRGCYSLTPGLWSSCSPTQAAGAAPHCPISPYITPHRPTSLPPITPNHRPASSPCIAALHRPTSPSLVTPHRRPTSPPRPPHLQQQLQEAGSMVRGSPPSWGADFQSLGVGREVQACEGLYLLRPSTGI